ncbi:MAG: hypothetical protein ACD_16C00019G0002 [uncultured bacterium]|nr:MAG: hypothetical protein ACD_16C00019G0002 [uncultured bacterium]HBG35405.1 hypothetical protein [Holosporales bacterium]HBW24163.1 hypothetical protein [Holosporales bacterium]
MSLLIYSQRYSRQDTPSQDKTGINPEHLPSDKKKQHPLMIQGELIALTGDPRTAAILGQLLYWNQQVNDFDLYIEEERNSSSKNHVFQHGWFCKSTLALMEETMLRVTIATFRRYLSFLTDREWVQTRRNSQNRWTGGRQYRVNLRKLSSDLQKKGYSLSGFAETCFAGEEERDPSEERSS